MSAKADQIVPEFWLRSMLAYPGLSDETIHAALKHAGLPDPLPDLNEREGTLSVTQNQEAQVLDALAHLTGEPFFGARAGNANKVSKGSLLTYISFSSATLRELLTLLSRYIHITRALGHLELEQTPHHSALKLGNADPLISIHPHHVEYSVGVVLSIATMAIRAEGRKRNEFVKAIYFATARRHGEEELSAIFGCPVHLGHSHHEIRFDNHIMDAPIATADPKLLEYLTNYGDILLGKRRRHPPELRHQIEAVVLPRLSSGIPSLADIARELAMSERTLSRRLSDAELSYRRIVDELRRELAELYLDDHTLSLAEIAFLLGFNDQSSFGTAYRRWSGQTPGKRRRAHV